MDWKQELGADIRQARRRRGWNQEQLAAEARIHTNTIGLWERGERAPQFDQLRLLAEALKRDHFNAGESMRIDFTTNGKPRVEPQPEQLEIQFDEKNGVTLRIESKGTALSIRKVSQMRAG